MAAALAKLAVACLPPPRETARREGRRGGAPYCTTPSHGRFNHVAPAGRSRRREHARARGAARRDRAADGNDVPLARRALGPRAAAARRCAAHPPPCTLRRFTLERDNGGTSKSAERLENTEPSVQMSNDMPCVTFIALLGASGGWSWESEGG